MKPFIHTLQDLMSYQLQGLYHAEKNLVGEFEEYILQATSVRLKTELKKYIQNTENKILKLERVFNYLMQEPSSVKNEVIPQFLRETYRMLPCTSSPHLRDILIISCFQNIIAYKICSLKTAYMVSLDLELDVPTDLIQQILEWEIEAGKELEQLGIEEFNKISAL